MATKVLVHYPVAIWQKQSYESVLNLDTEGLYVDFYITCYNPVNPNYDGRGIEKNPKWRENIAFKMNKARALVLNFNYDYLLNIEHDMIVPRNALKELLKYATPNRVLCALYRCRKIRNNKAPLCFHKKFEDGRITWVEDNYVKDKEMIEVYTIPFGCTLFGKNVLQKISFKDGIDGTFAVETDKLNIKKYIITKVVCGHIDRDGVIYYP